MGKLLSLVLSWFSSALIAAVAKWLFGGAIGFATYSVVETLFWRYINRGIAEITSIPELDFFINLSRLDDALSVVIGAMAMRASIIAMTVSVINNEV